MKRLYVMKGSLWMPMITFAFWLASSQALTQERDVFASHWKYVGIAVEEPGYTIWGTSPVHGDDGKVHLYVARWPGSTVEPGWRTHSEIAHYVGDSPEGPFTFSDIALQGTGRATLWKSDDGIHFDGKEQGFFPVAKYLGKERLRKAVNHYSGSVIKFERPLVLIKDGRPEYLYAPSGYHFFGGKETASYVLKFNDK